MVATGMGRYVTAAEFLTHQAASAPSELVRGVVHMMTPASGAHGVVAGTIFAALNAFVEEHRLGMCFPDNTGFQLPGLEDTVRSPDVAFVGVERLPPGGIGSGWMTVAPDLVVEILSPSETVAELELKLHDYLVAGTRTIWIIDPSARTVSIRTDALEHIVREGDHITAPEILPGFSLPVERIFARLARSVA